MRFFIPFLRSWLGHNEQAQAETHNEDTQKSKAYSHSKHVEARLYIGKYL